jgi:hypothetical protein
MFDVDVPVVSENSNELQNSHLRHPNRDAPLSESASFGGGPGLLNPT